jgi:hypothetical protein
MYYVAMYYKGCVVGKLEFDRRLGGPHIRSVNFGEEKFLDTAWNLTPVPQS